MYEGRIVAFCPPTIPEQELGLLMAGSETAGAATTGPEDGEAAGSAAAGPDGQESAGSAVSDPGGGPETPVQEQGSHE
jgi:hypothetical protein